MTRRRLPTIAVESRCGTFRHGLPERRGGNWGWFEHHVESGRSRFLAFADVRTKRDAETKRQAYTSQQAGR